MRQITLEWVEKAEGDFKVAAGQMRGLDPVYDVACFLAQQSVEKYLKAWLVEQGQPAPRIHDLEALGNLCIPSLPSLLTLMHDLRYLTSFAVEVRYPGLTAHQADALQCQQIAERVRDVIRPALGLT